MELPRLISCVTTGPIIPSVLRQSDKLSPAACGEKLNYEQHRSGKLHQTCSVTCVVLDGIPPHERISQHAAHEELSVGNLLTAKLLPNHFE